MIWASVLAFWGVALLLIVVPGADWAFALDAGLRRAVVPAVGGLVIGYLLMTGLVALGVGAFVASSPAALTVLTLVGGAYLVGHGAATLVRPSAGRAASAAPSSIAPEPAAGVRTFLGRGIGVSGLNPKGLLIFLSLLPQFTSPQAAWPVAGQIGVLGLTFAATCGVFYLALGALAARSLARRPRTARLIARCSGLGMAVVGALLVVEHVVRR